MAQTMSRREQADWRLDILVVDHDVEASAATAEVLEGVGHRVHLVTDGIQAVATAQVHAFDVVIAAVDARGIDGFGLLDKLREMTPTIHVILIAATPTIDHAVTATRARADYLTKPLASKNVLGPVAAVARRRETQAHVRAEYVRLGNGVEPIIGRSPLVLELKRNLEVIAQAEGSVLVCGESGTGKKLVARMLHAGGASAGEPMVTVNCASFSGDRLDVPEGSLFLDEVGELSASGQAEVLRAIDQGACRARIISATHHDLEAMVATGQFRGDLLYRLKVFRIDVPPLRKRRDDLPILVEYFCQKHSPNGAPTPTLSPQAWAVLASCEFAGNIRELEHVVRHALAFARGGDIHLEHLPAELRATASGTISRVVPMPAAADGVVPLSSAVGAFEHQYLRQALERTEGNRSRAASLLGISRKSLWAKLKRFEERQPGLTVAWRK